MYLHIVDTIIRVNDLIISVMYMNSLSYILSCRFVRYFQLLITKNKIQNNE